MFDRMLCWNHAARCLAGAWVGLLAVALVLPPSARGQTVRAVASVDSVQVGERFMLSLVARHSAASSVLFPRAETDTSVFGDVEALARTVVATRYVASGGNRIRIDSIAYEATTFALDTARVPAISARFVTGADTVRVAAAPLHIPVRSVLPPEPEGLHGLAPLASFPRARWPWVLLGLGALAAVLAYYWYRRRGTHTNEAEAPPSVPPYEAARQRLRTLEETTDWNDPVARQRCFVELSMTIRTYVARRTGIATLERTTREITGALHAETALPAPTIDTVREVLERADLVKFADRHPSDREGHTALEQARAALTAVERAFPEQDPAADAAPASPTPAGTKSASHR